jgi:putative transposase
MTERETEVILQRARENFPQARPRIISDNGPQFIAPDFKEFIRLCGMTRGPDLTFYPQSNGKIERWHQTLKVTAIRPQTPLTIEDARRAVARFVADYNHRRLHSAIGYVTPQAKLEGREREIFKERAAKLEAARVARQSQRQPARVQAVAVTASAVTSPPG